MKKELMSLTVDNQGCMSTATAEVSNYNVDNCVITQGISPGEDGFKRLYGFDLA